MPVTFSQIAQGTATVKITVSAGDITIVYYPNKITDKLIADMQSNTDANVVMSDLIKSWDVMTDEDASVMFPIDRMGEFGVPFKLEVIQAIFGAMRPEVATA